MVLCGPCSPLDTLSDSDEGRIVPYNPISNLIGPRLFFNPREIMPRIESINLLDSERCSSENHLEDTLSGYAHANRNRLPRILTSWEQMQSFLARHFFDQLWTERRPAGPRAIFFIRRLISITFVFGASVWLVFWAFRPLSRDIPPPPLPPLSNHDGTAVPPPGIFDVCSLCN